MSLYLIGGNSGTGKTTVRDELRNRGYEAYDIDNDAMAKWQHIEDGHIHPKSSVKAHERTPEFLATHSWNVPRNEVEGFRNRATDSAIFICGNLGNLSDLQDLFDGIVALYVDDKTLEHRLLTRTTGDWGKRPNELADTLEKHHTLYNKYRTLGAEIIDTTQPVDQVVETVLTHTAHKSA